MKSVWFAFAIALIALGMLGCWYGWMLFGEDTRPGSGRCWSLPESFQKSDLIGTWQMEKIRGQVTHTLILRADEMYKYIYENALDNHYRYESPWNRWYLEYRPNGLAYLHLVEMRLCYKFGCSWELDRRGEIRIGLGDTPVYDHCEQRVLFHVGREVILSVTGSAEFERTYGEKAAPRGILLWHLYSYESGSGWPYILIADEAGD